MFLNVSNNLKKLAKYFPENLYVVGGYVRNQVLRVEGSDIDLCSSVDIDQVSKRLENSEFQVKVKNLKMGTILIISGDQSYEYTAFRKEFYDEQSGHCPSKIVFTKSIEEDATRRDFSMNSVYYNINKDEVVDFYHGIIDLQERTIRRNIKGQTFLNDGERILRMVRFAGELNFKIEKSTFEEAKENVDKIKNLSGSRKFGELEKILYSDRRYNNKNNLKKTLKILNDLNVWSQFGLSCKKVDYKMVYKVEDRVLGLLIDIVDSEKPECLQAFLEKYLDEQFGLSGNLKQKIYDYLAGYYSALKKVGNKIYFFQFYKDWAFIYPLLGAKSKRIQNKYNFFYQYIIEHGLVIEISDLKIDENDLAKFKNLDKRHYSKILKMLLSKVFDGKLANKKAYLLKEVEKNLKDYV